MNALWLAAKHLNLMNSYRHELKIESPQPVHHAKYSEPLKPHAICLYSAGSQPRLHRAYDHLVEISKSPWAGLQSKTIGTFEWIFKFPDAIGIWVCTNRFYRTLTSEQQATIVNKLNKLMLLIGPSTFAFMFFPLCLSAARYKSGEL